ncbi:MAG: DUF4430 domain-containing protein [Desulfitobacteriaceae bacterium]
MKKQAVLFLIYTIMVVLLISGCKIAAKPASGLVPNSNMTGETVKNGAVINGSGQVVPANSVPSLQENSQVESADSRTNQIPVSATAASGGNQSQASTKPSEAAAASGANQLQVSVNSPEPLKNRVTISINCQTTVDKGLDKQEKFQGVVPPDGVILTATQVEISDGETVFSVLKRVTREHKILMEYEGSKGTPYIQGINGLYELDGGPLSGWVYCVNNQYPGCSGGEYKLKNGDLIEWKYTCDLGKDLGQELFSLK